jgi:uncharacterized repeat protein (TIGR01451 family)
MLASNVTFDPPNPGDGDLVTISATVLNEGTADALDVVVRFEDVTDGEIVLIGKQQIIDTIPAGDTATAQVVYDTTNKSGSRQIQVTVDPNDTIAESDETDNVATAALEVAAPPAPNLVVTSDSLAFDPSSPTVGDEVTVQVTVKNDGQVDASNIKVRFLDVTNGGSTPIGTEQTIDNILIGGSATAEVLYDTTGKEGEREIKVVVDPDSLIAETDETDNEATATLEVSPPSEEPPAGPNLALKSSNISFDPSSPAAGEPVTITVTVPNDGGEDANDVVVHVLDSTDEAELIQEVVTDTIEAGGSVEFVVTYDTTDKEGERSITVIADPNDDISETNEEDNEATRTLTVSPPTEGEGPGEEESPGEGAGAETGSGEGESELEVSAVESSRRPNLVVHQEDIALSPFNSREGNLITAVVVVYNEGTADARNVPVQFVEVTDGGVEPLGDLQVIRIIPAGGVAPVRVILDAEAMQGARTIGVVVDPDNLIPELDETDNEANTSLPSGELDRLDRLRPLQPLRAAVVD